MRTFLSLGLAVLFVLSLTSGVSAIPVGGTFDFSDTVDPSGSPGKGWSWTHTLEASDFTPPLDGTEPGLNFTSGTLTTIGDYILAPNSPDVIFYCFLQRAYGDSIFLGSLFLDQNSPGVTPGQGAYVAFDYQWGIALNQDALSALEDQIFGVRFDVVFPPGAIIKSIDSSTLSGSGSVPAHTPEPATMLLVGAGLLGLAGLGRKRFFKKA